MLDDAGWPEGAGALATAGQSLSATPILTGGGRKHCPFALANPAGPELQGPPPRLRGNGYWRSLRGAVTGPYCERQNLKMRRVAQLTRRIGIAPGGKHRHTTLVACFAGEHAKGGRWDISAGTLMARRPQFKFAESRSRGFERPSSFRKDADTGVMTRSGRTLILVS